MRRSPRADQPTLVQITRALGVAGGGEGGDSRMSYGGSTLASPCRNRAIRANGMRRVRGPTPTVRTSPPASGATST